MSRPTSDRRHWLVRPITIWLPTWKLSLAGLLALVTVTFLLCRSAHDFLAITSPVDGNVLVVEGWSPDYALDEAVRQFSSGHYDLLIASGGPMERGSLVTGFSTHADLAAASLRKLGVDDRRLAAAPAAPTYRNRTFQSALSVRELMAARSIEVRGVNVISIGVHARRSWCVYRKVLGEQYPVGIISLPSQEYDPSRWWRSSEGVKGTLTEAVGWLYETLLDGGRDSIPGDNRSAGSGTVSGPVSQER